MANRTGRNPRVMVDHPRAPEPSTARLWATLDGRQESVVTIPMTEEQLYELALEALQVAGVLRRQSRG